MKKYETGTSKARLSIEFDERQFVTQTDIDEAVNALVAETLAALGVTAPAGEPEVE